MMFRSKLMIWCSAIVLLGSVLTSVAAGTAHAGIATGSKFLGNIIASSVPSNFATYWNQVTPENGTKWGTVEGTRNSMNWTQADTAYNYARSNGFPFKFHTLVWGSQEPGWISGLSSADQKAEVTQWIQAAGQRYGNAAFVDVVNEPLHAKPSYRNAIGGDGSTGWDWVIWSFQQARQAFPNSKLLINEYGIISDPNAAANYVQIINLLKSRGLIDGIGIQCHQFNMDTVSVSTMRSVLSTLAATGLPIYVSELDMTGDDSTQLARYQEKFPVLWENSAVKGVTLWGYIEGQTWKSGTHLITSSGAERPALKWLKQYLGGSGGG
jgi:endo-1,4-beta-xylanase